MKVYKVDKALEVLSVVLDYEVVGPGTSLPQLTVFVQFNSQALELLTVGLPQAFDDVFDVADDFKLGTELFFAIDL